MRNQEMRDEEKSEMEFLVIRFETDKGLTVDTFGFAASGTRHAGYLAGSALKPFFMGKDTTAVPKSSEAPYPSGHCDAL
ncbi:MAG: hypothetical protein ABI254_01365 [Chthoniobacterales bacterium]